MCENVVVELMIFHLEFGSYTDVTWITPFASLIDTIWKNNRFEVYRNTILLLVCGSQETA